MKVLIDNTALHSIGRALGGEGSTKTEYFELLQFGNLILFADHVAVSTFEYKPIRARSDRIRRRLRGYGCDAALLSGQRFTAQRYADICAHAAGRLNADFDFVFPLYRGTTTRGQLWPEITGKLRDHLDSFFRLAHGETTPDAERALDASLPEKTTSAFAYAICVQPDLLERVRRWPSVSREQSVGLLVTVLRQYINEEIAIQTARKYAPSWTRGQLVAQHSECMASIYDHTIEDQIREVITTPCFSRALAARAKGDPRGFLQEAIALRGELSSVREALYRGTAKERREVFAFMRALTGERDTVADAFHIHSFLPFVTAKVGKLKRAWKHYDLSRKYRALAELAAASEEFVASEYMDRLLHNTMRNAERRR